MLSPCFPHAFNTLSIRIQQAFNTHSIRFPLPWRCLGCRRRRQGVLPKSPESQKVGRALRCAPVGGCENPRISNTFGCLRRARSACPTSKAVWATRPSGVSNFNTHSSHALGEPCTSLVHALYKPCTGPVHALYSLCTRHAHRMYALCTRLVLALYWPCTSRQPSFRPGRLSAFSIHPSAFPQVVLTAPVQQSSPRNPLVFRVFRVFRG